MSKLEFLGFTQGVVRGAIERYRRDGRNAIVAYYSSAESVGGSGRCS